MAGFAMGLLVGMAAGSGSPSVQASLLSLQVPLRCIAALERSEEEYRDCRSPSLASELRAILYTFPGSIGSYLPGCNGAGCEAKYASLDRNLKWEIEALRAIAVAQVVVPYASRR